jgi:hypothetical protein
METAERGSRVDPTELRALALRAHAFLSDVPLHDAWRFRLSGGGPGVTLQHVLDLFVEMEPARASRSITLLFALRRGLGRLLGWDRVDETPCERSYIHRLSAEDRARSIDPPGEPRAFWKSVYTFEREALGEVINGTVHAFLLFALESSGSEHTLYWGIYVKPVSTFTRYYMALIDPFRRWLIYPALIRRFETAWRLAAAEGSFDGPVHSDQSDAQRQR